ncbi:hypothetical protein LXL04_027379 [Taraxacum kok-saghyz]
MIHPQVRSEKQRQLLRLRPSASPLPLYRRFQATSSISVDDDPFSAFAGINDFEGGVLSLEEIDEPEYKLELPKGFQKGGKKPEKPTKRKREETNSDEAINKDLKNNETENEVNTGETGKDAEKKKKKKKKKKDKPPRNPQTRKKKQTAKKNQLPLQKPMTKLKMKKIKSMTVNIMHGAHQGKDVIGAAETGSGKTLAFGLPILQRLLEERDKSERQLEEKGQLALQVTDHLKQVAKGTDVRVVPIVGGMSTEKQERLLRTGRLWELMSGGEVHLVEFHSLSFFVLDEADRMIDNGS